MDFEKMTLAELKEEAKKNGIKNLSSLRKSQIVDLLEGKEKAGSAGAVGMAGNGGTSAKKQVGSGAAGNSTGTGAGNGARGGTAGNSTGTGAGIGARGGAAGNSTGTGAAGNGTRGGAAGNSTGTGAAGNGTRGGAARVQVSARQQEAVRRTPSRPAERRDFRQGAQNDGNRGTGSRDLGSQSRQNEGVSDNRQYNRNDNSQGNSNQGNSQGSSNQGNSQGSSNQGNSQGSYSQGSSNQGNSQGSYSQGNSQGSGNQGNSQGSSQGSSNQGNSQGSSQGSSNQGNSQGSYSQGSSNQGNSQGSYSQGNSQGSGNQGNSQGSSQGSSNQGNSQGSSQGSSNQGNSQGSYSQGNSQGSSNQGNSQGSYSQGSSNQGNSQGSSNQGSSQGGYNQGNYQNTRRIVEDPSEIAALDSGETKEGILEVLSDGYGFIRCDNYLPGDDDVYVSPAQIRRFNLKTGDIIIGNTRVRSQNEKFSALLYLKSVNGFPPADAARRPKFEDLTPIFPNSRLRLETQGENVLAMRMVDLIAPIGKGQRGMIVSQPKAGKTTLLKQVARAVTKNYPDMYLLILLIDERPEEVTDMKESIKGEKVEVIYSTFDELPENHKRVSEMVIERAKRLVEHGKDVVILLDSITRLARAYNLTVQPSGRTLSGGLDPAALHMPKRFFGAARNMREGGSLTVLATALVETGSRMDDVVFEEFKGTGNMELVLDRGLSEKKIFPAIDLAKSSTRRDDLLFTQEEAEANLLMKRALSSSHSDNAMENIIKIFKISKNNRETIEYLKKNRIM